MKDQVIDIVSRVLEMPAHDVNENSSADNIDTWDSLRHMRLILSLEEEFNVRFTENEIVILDSVAKIITTLLAMERKGDL